jgi:hypothetical protein
MLACQQPLENLPEQIIQDAIGDLHWQTAGPPGRSGSFPPRYRIVWRFPAHSQIGFRRPG